MSKNVLLIEDHQGMRENTCEMLELGGYGVLYAVNGRTGLAIAKEKRPNLIICDIRMPDLNGYEVLQALKNDSEIANIPFLFLSAFAEKLEIEAGIKMGAKGYLVKGFEMEEFLQTINNCLEVN